MGTFSSEARGPAHDSPNRWGDMPQGGKRPFSWLAITAIAVSAASFAAGPLHLIVAASLRDVELDGPVSALLRLLGLLSFPVGMVLSYLALVDCRLDRPLAGRGLAWGGLAVSYVSFGIWQAALTGLASSTSVWLFFGILALAAVHLLVFAAESTAGTYVLVGLVLGGTLFSLLSVWALRSREDARREQLRHNLSTIGAQLHEQWETRREPPGTQGGNVGQ